jgi:hypothetical protein
MKQWLRTLDCIGHSNTGPKSFPRSISNWFYKLYKTGIRFRKNRLWIPALGKVRQEDYEFKASLSYTAGPCFKEKKIRFETEPTWHILYLFLYCMKKNLRMVNFLRLHQLEKKKLVHFEIKFYYEVFNIENVFTLPFLSFVLRFKTIGSMSPWWLTASFCGFSSWCAF